MRGREREAGNIRGRRAVGGEEYSRGAGEDPCPLSPGRRERDIREDCGREDARGETVNRRSLSGRETFRGSPREFKAVFFKEAADGGRESEKTLGKPGPVPPPCFRSDTSVNSPTVTGNPEPGFLRFLPRNNDQRRHSRYCEELP